MVRPFITKSRYIAGLQCDKRLWLEVHDAGKAAAPSPSLERRWKIGREIGERARRRFPGGVLIEGATFAERLRRTAEAVEQRPRAIFEGAFSFGGVSVVADILERNDAGIWNLIEAKSSLAVRDSHVDDCAIQHHVLEACNVRIRGVFIMHLRADCAFPDFFDLFQTEEITERVVEAVEPLVKRLDRFAGVLESTEVPSVRIGEHCRRPFRCPFTTHCWTDVGELSIYDIPYLSPERRAEFEEKGAVHLRDLDPDAPLTESQRAYVNRMLGEGVSIDAPGIGERLSELVYPLYFLDFETDSPAVPRFAGVHPHEHVPFQYSVHVMEKDGATRHEAFLHTEDSDPRPAVGGSLLRHIGETGSVIAWYAPFEAGVLERLARDLPDGASRFLGMADRLWDQMEIFRDHYFHRGFGGSRSLKAVLPVVVPHLRYDDLDISNGLAAQSGWNGLIHMPAGPEKEKLERALLDYCRLDTLALVEIHRLLSAL